MKRSTIALAWLVCITTLLGVLACDSGTSTEAPFDGDRDDTDNNLSDDDDDLIPDGDTIDGDEEPGCPECISLPGRYCLDALSVCQAVLELEVTELAACRYQVTLTRNGAFSDQAVMNCPEDHEIILSGYTFSYADGAFSTYNDNDCTGFFSPNACTEEDGDTDDDDDDDDDSPDGDEEPTDGDEEPTDGDVSDGDEDQETGECLTGQRRCLEGHRLEICGDDEHWQLWQECDTDAGESCDNERTQCLTDCELHLEESSNLGCVFWAVNLANYGNEGYDGGSSQPNYSGKVKLFVSNPNDEAATLSLRTRLGLVDLGDNDTVAAKGSLEVELPQEAAGDVADKYVVDGGRIQYAGFRLSSSLPVFVYQFNPSIISVASSDASLLLPESTLGTLYLAMSVPHSYKRIDSATYHHPSGFTLVATEDDTTVTVTANGPTGTLSIPSHDSLAGGESHDLSALAEGEPRSFTLNAHEVLSLETASDHYCESIKPQDPVHGRNCVKWDDFTKNVHCYIYGRMFCQPGPDLSGSLVQSDKPVAVFGTAKNAMVPYYMFGSEHLEEQLFPVSTWGSDYVLGRQAPRYRYYTCTRGNLAQNHTSTCPYGSGMSFYRVLAAQDDTQITLKTPLENLTIEEAPKEYNYHNQVDWITSPQDTHWNGEIGGESCTIEGESCVVSKTLHAGEMWEFGDVFNHLLSATKGVMVTRLTPSEEYVGIPSYDSSQAYAELLWYKGGDPAMNLVVPSGQYRNDYQLYVVGSLRYGYLGLTAPAGARILLDEGTPEEVTLDTTDGTWEDAGYSETYGRSFVTRFYEIHNMSPRDFPREIPGSSVSTLKEGGGYHTLRGLDEALFGVEVYGFDHYISYAYPGGLDLKPINPL